MLVLFAPMARLHREHRRVTVKERLYALHLRLSEVPPIVPLLQQVRAQTPLEALFETFLQLRRPQPRDESGGTSIQWHSR